MQLEKSSVSCLCLQDIEAVDPEYYKNLRWMLENDITDVLDLTFTEEVDFFGKTQLVDLKAGGGTLKVSPSHPPPPPRFAACYGQMHC